MAGDDGDVGRAAAEPAHAYRGADPPFGRPAHDRGHARRSVVLPQARGRDDPVSEDGLGADALRLHAGRSRRRETEGPMTARTFIRTAIVTLTLAPGSLVTAHHSVPVNFDQTRSVTITGVL